MNYTQLLEKNYNIEVVTEAQSGEFHVTVKNQDGQQIRYEIYNKEGDLISVTTNVHDRDTDEDFMVVKTDTRGNLVDGHAPGLGLDSFRK
jgi:YD repeat-containing protein